MLKCTFCRRWLDDFRGGDVSMNDYTRGFIAAFDQGVVSIPYVLLQYYQALEITEIEMMLVMHIMAFKEREYNEFPTLDELHQRMQARPETVIQGLERLMKRKLVAIDEIIDPHTGIQSERYNLRPLYQKLAEKMAEKEPEEENWQEDGEDAAESKPKAAASDIFSMFEKEFARPLSPMECETISSWLDQDQYPEELIREALKEAVFAGKIHFRYIDRILMDWGRNRIRTVQEAKEYSQQFRSGR